MSPASAAGGRRADPVLAAVESDVLDGLDTIRHRLSTVLGRLAGGRPDHAGPTPGPPASRSVDWGGPLHRRAVGLLARERTTGWDLRRRAVLLHVIRTIARMSSDSVTALELTPRFSGGEDAEVCRAVTGLARVTHGQVTLVRAAFESRRAAPVESLLGEQPGLDRLSREVIRTAILAGGRAGGHERASAAIEVSRALEAIGHGTAEICEHALSLDGGLLREISDVLRWPDPAASPAMSAV